MLTLESAPSVRRGATRPGRNMRQVVSRAREPDRLSAVKAIYDYVTDRIAYDYCSVIEVSKIRCHPDGAERPKDPTEERPLHVGSFAALRMTVINGISTTLH